MKNIIKALKLVMPIAPFRMMLYLLVSLPGAILPTVMLYLQRFIVDSVANVNQDFSIFYYIKPVFMLIGTYMVLKLFSLLSNQYMEFGYFRYVFMGLDAKIHEKSDQLSLEYYDNAQYYQIVQNAKKASMFLVFTANLAIMSFIVICNLLSVGSYLAALNPILIIFVVLVSIPVIIEKLQGAKYQSNLIQDTVQATRRKKYNFDLLAISEYKKELAHQGASCYIAEKYMESCKEANTKEWYYIQKMGYNSLIFAAVKSVFHACSIFLMVWLLVTGNITIGGFSILLTSFSALTNAFTQLFNHAGEILQTSVMSASFFKLMDLEIKDGEKDMDENEEIARLEHVSYKYLNSDEFTLKDISLSIKKGEKVAIVGENGAGKTTLAKLLSGFLLPTEGTMKLGGVSREQLHEKSIFNKISAVYQDFGHYKLTLAQNVYLGDTIEGNTLKQMDLGKIKNALEWAGLSFSMDPEKMELGREFGGVEMSGGQWQRLALARSYYRQRPMLFLDEPTAAIDPLEEMAIYNKLNELASGRTVILVTHRLGAVRNADKIIMLDNGRIIESGNFEQLIEQKGQFYHIWNEQVKWYQSGGRK